ncbi:DeoR/GlpR family DNA-binding transcription regulator [Niallia sp. 01092]|uniref:DeoR/GlpR family DNA-binding transcription regulator n=1 Tax=unclassified Niallia TaxID=2837522 RepID=UPI003FD678BF
MYQEERLVKILEILNKQHSMAVQEICERFNISRDTARRDIVKLVEQGAAIRTHGGISLPAIKETILAYRERVQSFSNEKRRIGKYASGFLDKDGVYFFDVSTTVCCLAEQVNKQMQVFTHSLDIAEVLANQSYASLFLFGGKLNEQNRFFFDIESINQLDKIKFDAAFLGAAAVMEDGIYFEDKEDASIKNMVVHKSSKNIILADFNKFSSNSYYKGMNWENIHVLITDQSPPPVFCDIISAHNIMLCIAD